MALISVNLGIMNLFPLPVLDGGHLVFLAAEAVRGKPLSERIQNVSYRIGQHY
ncbi:zinc metalloprotease [Pasteurella canis]|nr:zinc metalloprotease [Pasteurella canis]